jgi:hypothetical protein
MSGTYVDARDYTPAELLPVHTDVHNFYFPT